MNICAVIVTFNRLELLKECLQTYLKQNRIPDNLIIVNNASTDGTKEYLTNWEKQYADVTSITVIHSEINTGGSGGFYMGTAKALELNADWVWVSDDDAMLENDIFEKMEKFINNSNENISAVCTAVINNGEIDLDHRHRKINQFIRYKFKGIPIQEYKKDYFEIDAFSYVGTMMNAEKLRKVGLVNKGFFLWHDDKEHSLRLLKEGKIICLPALKIHHDVERIRYTEVSWKYYYGYRNDLLMLKYHFPKRYYAAKKMIMRVKGMKDKDKNHLEIVKAAIKAADDDCLGLHPVYRPGWKSK